MSSQRVHEVYDFTQGKYGSGESLDELPVPSHAPPPNVELLAAMALIGFAGGLVAAYLMGAFLIG